MDALTYLSLGTNLGNRLDNLTQAVALLASLAILRKQSAVYETPPWGYLDQPSFLNQVLEVNTPYEPLELLKLLKDVEYKIGRRPTFRYGPRLIDLDILFYNDLVFESPTLTIPHPTLHTRAFVLVPLSEIAPDLRHPVLDKTVSELVITVDPQGIHRYATAATL
jgi:2-amino-4-hydroxy-6-hydroxymethyldihydropteridine diphosphokinase